MGVDALIQISKKRDGFVTSSACHSSLTKHKQSTKTVAVFNCHQSRTMIFDADQHLFSSRCFRNRSAAGRGGRGHDSLIVREDC